MASKEMSTSVRDQLTCSLCSKLFQDPVTLTCCHSFCKKCITSYITESNSESNPKCPSCQEPVVGNVHELLSNSVLNKVVAALKINQDRLQSVSNKFVCQVCDENLDISHAVRCVDCKITYCSPCRETVHPPKGVFVKHKLCFLTERILESGIDMECLLHKKDFVYFCLECSIAVCLDCHNENHADHACDILSKAHGDQRKNILSAIQEAELAQNDSSEMIGSQRQQLCSMKKIQKQRMSCIQECFVSLRQALDAREHELLRKEENEVGVPINEYEALVKETETQVLQLDSILSVAKATIKEDHELSLLMVSKPLISGLDKCRSPLLKRECDFVPSLVSVLDSIDVVEATNIIASVGIELTSNKNTTSAEGCPKQDHHFHPSPTVISSTTSTTQNMISSQHVTFENGSKETYCRDIPRSENEANIRDISIGSRTRGNDEIIKYPDEINSNNTSELSEVPSSLYSVVKSKWSVSAPDLHSQTISTTPNNRGGSNPYTSKKYPLNHDNRYKLFPVKSQIITVSSDTNNKPVYTDTNGALFNDCGKSGTSDGSVATSTSSENFETTTKATYSEKKGRIRNYIGRHRPSSKTPDICTATSGKRFHRRPNLDSVKCDNKYHPSLTEPKAVASSSVTSENPVHRRINSDPIPTFRHEVEKSSASKINPDVTKTSESGKKIKKVRTFSKSKTSQPFDIGDCSMADNVEQSTGRDGTFFDFMGRLGIVETTDPKNPQDTKRKNVISSSSKGSTRFVVPGNSSEAAKPNACGTQ